MLKAKDIIAAPVKVCATPQGRRKFLHASHYGEHLGFVALAAVETLHMAPLLWYVSVWLLVTGIGAVIYDRITGE